MATIRSDRVTVLPPVPFDGQSFIDSSHIRWIYSANNNVWINAGQVDTVPLASSELSGLLSAQDKVFIDSLPAVGGGFGLIVKPQLLLATEDNPEGIIQGDITLFSESLDIECIGSPRSTLASNAPCSELRADCVDGDETIGLAFRLSEKFLKSLIFDLPGSIGPEGNPGPKGKDGEPSVCPTPVGDKGPPGKSRTETCKLVGPVYEDVDGVFSEAIVDIKTSRDCIVSAIKAPINVPENSKPADQVIATPVIRSIIFPENPGGITDWELTKPSTDDTELDLLLLRIPTEGDCTNIAFASFQLSNYINDIVKDYEEKLIEFDEDWRQQVKAYIEQRDDEARKILANLANKIAECERKVKLCASTTTTCVPPLTTPVPITTTLAPTTTPIPLPLPTTTAPPTTAPPTTTTTTTAAPTTTTTAIPTTTTICFQSVNVDFEPPFYLSSGSGNPLNGIDGWTDNSGNWDIFPYIGNTLGVNLNSLGDEQFIAAQVGPASPTNHDLNCSGFGAVRLKFDINAQFLNSISAQDQEIGSLSLRPIGINKRDFKIALQWQDSSATQLAMVLLVYNSLGIAQPAQIPGAAWDNLVLNRWYRINILLSFISGRVDLVKITDLVTSISTTNTSFGWYLGGGASPVGFPTDISLVSGGPISDSSIIAFDNVWVECNPYITSTPVTSVVTGQPYTYQPTAVDGLPPYQWQFNCATIPSGMTINPSTGLITWPTTGAGIYSLSIDVTDSIGNSSPGLGVPDNHQWILNVNTPSEP